MYDDNKYKTWSQNKQKQVKKNSGKINVIYIFDMHLGKHYNMDEYDFKQYIVSRCLPDVK